MYKYFFSGLYFVLVVTIYVEARHIVVENISVRDVTADGGQTTPELSLWCHGFTSGLQIIFTSENAVEGSPCYSFITEPLSPHLLQHDHAVFTLTPAHVHEIIVSRHDKIWACVRSHPQTGGRARHMTTSRWIHLGLISSLKVLQRQKRPQTLVLRLSNKELMSEIHAQNSYMEKRDTIGMTIPATEGGLPETKISTISNWNSNETVSMENGSRGRVGLQDVRLTKQINSTPLTANDTSSLFKSNSSLRITSLRVEAHEKGLDYDDYSGNILFDTDAQIRFFGSGFTEATEFLFTSYEAEFGTRCGAHTTKVFKVDELGNDWATATIQLPLMTVNQSRWFLCAREGPEFRAYHQGLQPWLTIKSYNLILPIWIQACFIVILLCLSGIFSGLNLGLMALDKTELKILANTGSPIERGHAKAIEPVRAHGNYLLCTLLLGNVLVNSTLTIILDGLSTGLIAVIGSTIGIVLFGEIFPQAICSRHGLAVGARTVWLVRIFMVLTGPMSWPISKILDFVLGEEIGNTYNRDRLKELIKLTHGKTDLKAEETNVICAALEFHRKTVTEVMTQLNDIYMLSIDASLNFDTINEIMQQGYSRVPVYEGKHTNIVSVLFIKDLAFIDPDDNTPLKTLCQFYQNPLNFVFEDTTLDIMLKDFKEGIKGHMAFVHKVNKSGQGDPYYEVVGLVTLEDVIEELIQEEIVDETDVFTDNSNKQRRHLLGRRDFTEFSQNAASQANTKKTQISSQMQVAAFQYLRTSVDPFKEGQLSEAVVKRLINQDIVHNIKVTNKEESKSDLTTYIYTQGKPADYFVLILEGHVEVVIGKEGLTFENGPFTFFGLAALPQVQGIDSFVGESPLITVHRRRGSIRSIQSLDSTSSSFVPDYSVRAISEVYYLKINCSHYVAARRAFLLELSQKKPSEESVIEESMREESVTKESCEGAIKETKRDGKERKESIHDDNAIKEADREIVKEPITENGRKELTQECQELPNGTKVTTFNNKKSLGIANRIDPPSAVLVSYVKNPKATSN